MTWIMNTLIILTLSSYALTFLLTVSRIGEKIWRNPLSKIFNSNKEVVYFLGCRMCTGFWVSLGLCFFYGHPGLFLPVYGLSYFLATQER